ncbi:hypothetical protein EV363DRAFT_1353194 [Boletus edulis]|nr:hypothetical protein EV363DRAFT_1353194 [Boletus edulis]
MLFSHTSRTLFPNLRFLSWGYERPFRLSHIAAQPMRTLHLDFRCGEISECRNVLDSVGNLCPLIERFRLYLSRQYVELDTIMSNQVLRWSNLRILECSDVALNADAILHISRTSTLTHLSFVLNEEAPGQILPSDLDLVFPNLTWCDITSGRLLPVANLFARTRLPAIKELTVRFPGSPSKQAIWSFMTSLKNTCSSSSLTHLSILSQRYLLRRLSTCGDLGSNNCPITYDDLHPCASLCSLRFLKLNFDQPIHLTDNDLVGLGTAWPHLEDLIVNNDAGWRSIGGLTLPGLIRLLRTCPSLRNFCILLDTPTFVYIPEGMETSYPPRQLGCVNLVESPLDADMFDGVVDVFVTLKFSPRLLIAWRRVETEQRRAVGVPQTAFRSWRDLDDKVKARIASATETKDEMGA